MYIYIYIYIALRNKFLAAHARGWRAPFGIAGVLEKTGWAARNDNAKWNNKQERRNTYLRVAV